MKKLLMLTDFSVQAENAGRYAVELASAYKASLFIANSFLVPENAVMASRVVWPLVDYGTLKSESIQALSVFAQRIMNMAKHDAQNVFQSTVELESHPGTVLEVTCGLIETKKIDLVVMGMTGAGVVPQVLFGSSCRTMIENATFPVLYIPGSTTFKPIKTIGFATDLSDGDITALQEILRILVQEHMQIRLIHITKDEVIRQSKYQVRIDEFINRVKETVKNINMTYEYVFNTQVDDGLQKLTKDLEIDILVMIHRHRSFIPHFFHRSHTHKVARNVGIPLLVIPDKKTL